MKINLRTIQSGKIKEFCGLIGWEKDKLADNSVMKNKKK
jgi:hypothetical protein